MTTNPTIPTIEMLKAAGARFADHADRIVNQARLDVANDLKLAARISIAYAALRFSIAEEAGITTDRNSADRLRSMLIEEL